MFLKLSGNPAISFSFYNQSLFNFFAKQHGDEDALIGILLSSAEQMCKDVGRLSDDQWEAVNAADRDAENGVTPTREQEALRSTCRVAILYALGYLYEHRDEADHKQLMLTLRSILFAVREGVF